MEANHTSGPWFNYGHEVVDAKVGLGDFSRGPLPANLLAKTYAIPKERGTREANARLTAAAPELLAALETLLKEWESKERADGREWGQREVVMARAAIAKAKGEEDA